MKTLGQINYEAYWNNLGDDIVPWSQLPDPSPWERAAKAVAEEANRRRELEVLGEGMCPVCGKPIPMARP